MTNVLLYLSEAKKKKKKKKAKGVIYFPGPQTQLLWNNI